MNEIILLLLEKVCEAVYFSLFLIIGKNIKNKRLLLIGIMIFEYLALKHFLYYNVWFQLAYTFMSFVNLKVLYREKAQVTDIFLFMVASIILILLSAFTYITAMHTYKSYHISLIFNRVLIFGIIFIFRNFIKANYKSFCSLWNRHNNPNKIRSLTLRNISIIIFNLMFWLINFGLAITIYMGERGI